MAEKSHAYAEQVPVRFERDMGYSEKEFFRVLPSALGDYQFRVQDKQILIEHPKHPHRIKLEITPLPDRRLGAFRIERIDVQFELLNMTDTERMSFMRRFDRRFQRGGG